MTDVATATAVALPRDPGWDRYFRWPTDYFPIQFPACRVELSLYPHPSPDEARIDWRQAGSVALLSRVVGADGGLIHELPPREPPAGASDWTESLTVQRASSPAGIGLAFTWWFYVPPCEIVPQHPMGVVLGDPDFLFGHRAEVRVTAQRRPEPVPQSDRP